MDDFDWIRDSSLELPKNREELKHVIGWYFIWDESCGRKCNGSWGHSGRKWLINEIGYQVNFTDTFTNEKINYNVITFINNLLTGSWVLVSPEGVLFDPLYNRVYNPRLTESEEDEWDWAKGSILIDEPYEGLKIRVHNLGDENSFLNWIGSHNRVLYIRGQFGDHIEGEVYYVGDRFFALKTKYGRIFFPSNHKELEKIREGSEAYKGLNISYEPI
jgi:hypothetical protein